MGHWLGEVTRFALKSTIKMLVGNKSDDEPHRAVPAAEGKSFAARMGVPFLETSAKTAENVDAAFVGLARMMIAGSGPQPVQRLPTIARVEGGGRGAGGPCCK